MMLLHFIETTFVPNRIPQKICGI